MTKSYPNNTRAKEYADRPIPISTSEDDEDEEIICPSCWCNTVIRVDSGDDYCSRCKHTVKVKREVEAADIVESESMDSHNETLISNLPDPNESFYNRGKVEPQGAFKALQDRGIHVTSYTERGGDGRITRSWNEGSNSSAGSDRKVSSQRPMRFTEDRNSEEEE
jgi:hypothetical protein